MSIQPVVPNYPAATTSLTNKYAPQSQYANPQQLLAALNGLPIPPHLQLRAATQGNVITPLLRYDAARANRGINPLTPRQSALALRTLTTGQPATPPRRQGLLRGALSNLRDLVGAIPKLPIMAFNEIKALPEGLSGVPEALSEGANPIEALGNVANLPGFRMVPGAFVAGQFGDEGQGVQGLLANPLFTALDVLPLASGAAAGTKVVKAARAENQAANVARVEQALALTTEPGTARLRATPRPLSTLATRRLTDSGAVERNALGQAISGLGDLAASTPSGRAIQATFLERDTARLESRHTSLLRRLADPNTPRATLPTTVNGRSILPELDLRDEVVTFGEMAQAAGIDPARNAELFRLAENPRLPDGTPTRPELIPGLTDPERALLVKAREIQAEAARLTEGDLTRTVTIDGTPEVYDLPTAQRLTRAQATLHTAQELHDARQMVLDPSAVTPDTIASRIADVEARRADGTLTASVADDLARTYRAALDEAGWVADEASGQYARVARPDDADLLAAMRPLERRYTVVGKITEALKAGRWSEARKRLDGFAETRAGGTLVDALPFDIDGLKAELSRRIARDRALSRTSAYTDKRLEQLAKRVEQVQSRAVPARFRPAVQKEAAARITERVQETYTGTPDFDRIIDMASNRVYDAISELPEAEVRLLQRQAAESWRALRDAGHDPIFFSHVTPQQRARLPYTRVSDTPVTPAAAKARMNDATPYVEDMGVALTKGAMDLMQRRGTEAFLDEFEASYGRTRASLTDELYPRAQARFAAVPSIPLASHLNDLINERWQPWDRSAFSPRKTTGAFSIASREQTMVPRVMAENMTRLFNPPLPKLTAALDPVMRVFRTSVLPLAPRWHIYNAVGGGAMTAVQDINAFRYLPEVIREMWVNREATGGIGMKRVAHQMQPEGAPPSGFGTMPAEVRAWDHEIRATSPLKDRLAATHNYAAGRTLRNWWDQARAGRLGKIQDAAKRGLEGSYNANQLVDDMYRSAVGISAKHRALKAGMSDDMAEALAVHSIRRTFQAWDEMTPMERSIMRTVVPFYGWCVDRDTEALTKRGWVNGEDLREDDTILSMDPTTKQMHWSSIKSIFRNPNYSGSMHQLQSRGIDALVTPHHKFATTEGELLEVEQLRQRHVLQIMGTAVDGPTIYDDAFVEVVGWAVTEGHYKRNRSGNITTIEISQKDSGQHTPRIRETLKRAGAQWHEFLAGVDHKIRYFGVTGEIRRQILEVAPERVMTMEFICSLNAYQRDLLIETMLDADGSRFTHHRKYEHEQVSFSQKDRRAAEMFATLCTLSGRPTFLRSDTSPSRKVDSWHVGVRQTTVASVVQMKGWTAPGAPVVATPPQVHYEGLVWCPETEYGTFVCRRRGIVHVTGNTSHILKYAMRYPFDHPLRVAVLGSFARAELTDALTGLPQHIRDMVLMGDVRANGVVRALNVGPFNPFRDLPSNFTVAGFLGNLNPILTGVLESVGVNVQQGGPSLYPETRYDPETGRLVADPSGNLVSNIIGNISPQLQLITAISGHNEAFNQLLARDPEAAGRQLMSNLGIPVFYRSIDVGEELIRAEMARFEDQENARKQALRTGDLSILGDFPGLAAYGEQVRALDAAGQLDTLRPPPGGVGLPERIDKAYALQTALLGSEG